MKKITCGAKKKQPKIKTEMTGKGLTVHGGLLPVLTFMERLHFYKAVETALHKQRGANARYQFADAVQMVTIGVMTGACAMTQVAAVWADDVLKRMAGYKEVPVDTSLGRIIKKVSFSDVASMEGLNHSFRNRIWKHAVRSGIYLKSALSVIWLDVDSMVDGVCGSQEGAAKGYNPKKERSELLSSPHGLCIRDQRSIAQLVSHRISMCDISLQPAQVDGPLNRRSGQTMGDKDHAAVAYPCCRKTCRRQQTDHTKAS